MNSKDQSKKTDIHTNICSWMILRSARFTFGRAYKLGSVKGTVLPLLQFIHILVSFPRAALNSVRRKVETWA